MTHHTHGVAIDRVNAGEYKEGQFQVSAEPWFPADRPATRSPLNTL